MGGLSCATGGVEGVEELQQMGAVVWGWPIGLDAFVFVELYL